MRSTITNAMRHIHSFAEEVMTMERKLAAVVQQTEGGTQLLPPRDGQQQHPIEVGGRCNDVTTFSFYDTFLSFFFL